MPIELVSPNVYPSKCLATPERSRTARWGIVGYALAAGVAVVMLPVVPFVAALWLLGKFAGGTREPPRSSPTG